MNYEIKSVNPLSVLMNTARIFIVLGFIAAVLTFFGPSRGVPFGSFLQRLAATLLFTIVYTVVVTAVLTFVAWLYNLWARNYQGIHIHLEPKD